MNLRPPRHTSLPFWGHIGRLRRRKESSRTFRPLLRHWRFCSFVLFAIAIIPTVLPTLIRLCGDMGFHIFSGLATTPPDTTSKTDLPGWHNDSSLYMPHRSSTLLGGACSTRSQFREGISAVATTTTSAASSGARVDGFPSEPSEASAKKRESLVGSIRADSLARSKIKKRSLLRAIRRAQLGQDSFYKGRRLTCDPQYNYKTTATTAALPAPRLNILSWNCSGLTQHNPASGC